MTRLFSNVDMNRMAALETVKLPAPSHVRSSRKKLRELELQNAPSPRLTFRHLQRRLYDLLAMDFDSMEAFHEANALSRDEIEEAFFGMLCQLDMATEELIRPLVHEWEREGNTPLSVRILSVLMCKRRKLRRGMEMTLQELLDQLLLSARLGERLTLNDARALLSQLGPNTRRQAEVLLDEVARGLSHSEDEESARPQHSSFGYVSAPHLYLAFRNGVRTSLETSSHFSGRYYTIAFDDLVEMDDSVPPIDIYRAVQTDVTPLMRNVTCELLLSCALDTRLDIKMETYFLAVNVLDRFLGMTRVASGDIFLYGTAALLVAIKYEERYTPSLRFLVDLFKGVFTVEALLAAEVAIVSTLNVHVGAATISLIADALLVAQDPPASAKQRHVLLYIISTLAVRTYAGQYKQSLLAAAAVHISRAALAIPTGEPCEAVRSLFPVVLEALERNNPDASVGKILYGSFAQKRFSDVSRLPYLMLFAA